MKLAALLLTLAAGGLVTAWTRGDDPVCLQCEPYADHCRACKDCTKCHWCSVKGGTCSVCLEK